MLSQHRSEVSLRKWCYNRVITQLVAVLIIILIKGMRIWTLWKGNRYIGTSWLTYCWMLLLLCFYLINSDLTHCTSWVVFLRLCCVNHKMIPLFHVTTAWNLACIKRTASTSMLGLRKTINHAVNWLSGLVNIKKGAVGSLNCKQQTLVFFSFPLPVYILKIVVSYVGILCVSRVWLKVLFLCLDFGNKFI